MKILGIPAWMIAAGVVAYIVLKKRSTATQQPFLPGAVAMMPGAQPLDYTTAYVGSATGSPGITQEGLISPGFAI